MIPYSASQKRVLAATIAFICFLLAVTGAATADRKTWLMEVAPVFIALPILVFTFRRFPLTPLVYFLITLHAVVLITGGFYTYAKVPLGFWIQHVLSLGRNPYDRIGHLMQGFVPALIAREIFIRGRYVAGRSMTIFLAICVVMTVSAGYELIEWVAALALGRAADDFLGTQGDTWDTQWDMFCAWIGSVVALTSLSRLQDRQIASLNKPRSTS